MMNPNCLYSKVLLYRAVLHCASFRATCLAILLRCKLHDKLHDVTYLAIIKSLNIFVAASFARSKIQVLFFTAITATPKQIFEVLHSVTPF